MKLNENLHRIAQRAIERAMFGVTLRDKYKSTWISAKTRVKDIVEVIKQEKWRITN